MNKEGKLYKKIRRAVTESIIMGKTVSGLEGILDEAKQDFPKLEFFDSDDIVDLLNWFEKWFGNK